MEVPYWIICGQHTLYKPFFLSINFNPLFCVHFSDDAKKVLPAVCFEPDGMIVPPQLREAYAQIGIYLHDTDFQVLWERFVT